MNWALTIPVLMFSQWAFAVDPHTALELIEYHCSTAQTPGETTPQTIVDVEPEKTDVIFRNTKVGDRYIYDLAGEIRIRIDDIKTSQNLGRLNLELSDSMGPKLFIGMDRQCQVRGARELIYQDGQVFALEILGPDFFPVAREALNPPIPSTSERFSPKILVAMVDSGVNYFLPEINNRLARDVNNDLIGFDFWDMDSRPFDAHLAASPFFVQRHGTRSASLLLQEAPEIGLVSYRYPRPDMQRMTQLLQHASNHKVRVIGMPLGSSRKEDWRAFEQAAGQYPEMLFIVSAGNNGVNIDHTPMYPASLDINNMIVVTSANEFLRPAERSNWGIEQVDFMVPAERQSVVKYTGKTGLVSGSSYAVSRIAAMAAQIILANPDINTDDLIAGIRGYALPVADGGYVKYGYIPDPLKVRGSLRFKQLDTYGISPNPRHTLTVNVLILDRTWNTDLIQNSIEQAHGIFSQCDSGIRSVNTYVAKHLLNRVDLGTGIAHSLIPALRSTSEWTDGITLVFVRGSRMEIQFDAQAFGNRNTKTRPWMRDTVWVTQGAKDLPILLAHEMFHVLADSGEHSDIPGNLMSNRTDPANQLLTDQQCSRLSSNQ